MLVPDLAAAHDRWPWYVTAAAGTGLAAVYAFPLRTHGVALATLTLFGRRTGPLSVSAANDAEIVGDLCATVVAHDLDDRFANAVADRRCPRRAVRRHRGRLGDRPAQHHLGVDDALTRQRAAAFGRNVPLARIARRRHQRPVHARLGEAGTPHNVSDRTTRLPTRSTTPLNSRNAAGWGAGVA